MTSKNNMRPGIGFWITFLTFIPVSSSISQSWQANPAVIRKFQEERPSFIYEEDKVPDYVLPPLLPTTEGDPETLKEEWIKRRPEILNLFKEHVYGYSPERAESVRFTVLEEDPKALNGQARFQRVEIRCTQEGREHAFELILFLPKKVKEAVPLFLLLNNRPKRLTDPSRETISEFWPVEEVIARGYGIAAIQLRDIAPDSATDFRNGIIRLFEEEGSQRPANAWGTLAAWAWAASRAMDYFETLDAVDKEKIAVLGHSRGGKAALWAGVTDERFGLVISNASGCGGAALSRREFGETVARINQNYPHWFCSNFHAYGGREKDLPVDQHMLLALVAPRAIYVASADEDLWADPKGEFLALAHASPVYEWFGYRGIAPDAMPGVNQSVHGDRQGYHIREGRHDLTLRDWNYFMDFADKLWPRSSN